MIKYRELLRAAARDEETLTKLESERQILALEQARKEDPWELISIQFSRQASWSPKRMIALGLFAGLFAAEEPPFWRTGALALSTRTNSSLLPCPLIDTFLQMVEVVTDAADLLAAGPLAQSPGNSAIALIPIGSIPNEQLQAFSKELRRALAGRELLVSTTCAKPASVRPSFY